MKLEFQLILSFNSITISIKPNKRIKPTPHTANAELLGKLKYTRAPTLHGQLTPTQLNCKHIPSLIIDKAKQRRIDRKMANSKCRFC